MFSLRAKNESKEFTLTIGTRGRALTYWYSMNLISSH